MSLLLYGSLLIRKRHSRGSANKKGGTYRGSAKENLTFEGECVGDLVKTRFAFF